MLPTSGFGIGIVSGADIEAFPEAAGRAVTVYGVRFTDRGNINAQNVKLHGLLGEKGYSLSEWMDAKNNKRVSMPWGNISSMKSMSFPVSIVFFLLSCLIVGVMILRMVKSDGVVIGTLYARNPEAFDDLAAPTALIIAATTIVAGLMAVIIIFIVTSLIIDENRNTTSLLKIFGYRRKDIAKLILNSSTPAVFIGFWLGLPFMLVFGNYLYGYVAEITNMLIPMTVNPLYVLISFVVIFVVYEVTKRLCGRKLAKISMSDALKAGTE